MEERTSAVSVLADCGAGEVALASKSPEVRRRAYIGWTLLGLARLCILSQAVLLRSG
jgi:glutamine phosphoribosylpyrophosphate amidotransferase